jgi:hypothetical protein|nr:copper amine oxidase N-terminal domain-containing protein [uncultured Oscillibacter sp.]
MKKMIALALSLVLALALTVPAYAAEPETVGVMVNGDRVAFSDAAPELRDGNTMVPLRDLVEALGGQVTPVDGALRCTFEAADGQEAQQVLVRPDSSSYYKNGRTYVPVRAIAEPLGYDVFWDSGERAAVLIDSQEIIDGIDRQFTILNKALTQLQQERDPEKHYRTQLDYTLSVDALDEISGQRTQVDIALTGSVLTSAHAVELQLRADLSDLGNVISGDMVRKGYLTSLKAAVIGKALEDLTLEARYDLTTGDLYLSCPALAQLNELTGLNAHSDDWYHLTLPAVSSLEELSSIWGETLGLSRQTMERIQSGEGNSVGGILYLCSELLSQTPAQIPENAEMAGQVLAQLLGDDHFRSSGTTQKLHIGIEELEALLGQEGLLEEMFKTLGLDLTVRQDGSLAAALEVAFQEAYLDGDSASLEGNMELSGHHVALNLSLTLGDLMDVQYDLTETIRETTDQPQTAPPAGSTVVELGDAENMLSESSAASTQVTPAA